MWKPDFKFTLVLALVAFVSFVLLVAVFDMPGDNVIVLFWIVMLGSHGLYFLVSLIRFLIKRKGRQ